MIPGRGIRFPGLMYSSRRAGGTHFARSPRRPPSSFSEAERANQQLFKGANVNASVMSAAQQMTSRRLSEVTAFNVRDLLVATLYGRQWRVPNGQGGWRCSVVARQDTSELLDAFGQIPGTMLWRGETWWELILPGTPGDVLSLDVDGVPYWTPGSSVSGPKGGITTFQRNNNLTADTTNFATKGFSFIPDFNLEVKELWWQGTFNTGETYQPMIAKSANASANGNFTAMDIGDTFTSVESLTNRWMMLRFNTAIQCLAGQNVFFGIIRTDGNGTSPCRINGFGTGNNDMPLPGRFKRQFTVANKAPAVGTAYTVGGTVFGPMMGQVFVVP